MKCRQLFFRLAALILVLSCLCACTAGSGESVKTSAEASVSVSMGEPEVEASNTVSDAGSQVEQEQLPEQDSSVLYPLFDEKTTVNAFLNIAPWASAYIGPEAEFENSAAILAAEEATNIHLDVNWSDPDSYNEKVNLLIASSTLPEITRNLSTLYSSGIDGLIADGVCLDISEFIPECAPEYNRLLEEYPNFRNVAASSSGAMVSMFGFRETPVYTLGPVVRKDMLDAVGKDIPTTVEELHDVARALKNDYGVEAALVSPKLVQDAYCGVDFISSNDVQMTWWNIDGTVTAAVTLDSNLEWIKEMKQWNEDQLFVDSWYDPAPFYDMEIMMDQLAIAYAPYSLTATASSVMAINPDTFSLYPMANVTLEPGDTIKTQNNSVGGRGDGDWCITTTDEDLAKKLVSYVNWFFTEEGITVSNFGTKDVSFTYDEDGSVQFTDLVRNDPNGYGSMAVYAIYTNYDDNPYYCKQERIELTYDNEVEATCYDVWLSNMTSEYICTYTLTEEESTQYNHLASDVITAISENMTKFMIGDRDIQEWDSFLETLDSMGLEEMRTIIQGACDRGDA